MENEEVQKKLSELMGEFKTGASSENEHLISMAKQNSELQTKLKNSVDSLQESLDYLRVLVKYQLFDLEATRRENQYLKQLLENKEG